ncbi:MAG: beta-glucosidase [Sphingomonadales bacterium]|jgi:beta-glucosidase
MTVQEKVGQMSQIDLGVLAVGKVCEVTDPIRLDTARLRLAFQRYKVGSVLNCGCGFHALSRKRWLEIIDSIQQANNQYTSHGIPVLYGIDAIHGANYTLGSTLFPQQIGQAATWNPELVKAAARITAYETRASGIPWNFSPVLDIGRQPLWSRFFETYGEDVCLAKKMTNACITGYQGNTFGNEQVAACMKHFLGYSYPLSGKDRTPVWIGERELRAYFLPTFQEAIRLKAKTLMINSGELNGVPVHASFSILTTLLRDELGFEGIAVTDWEDVYKLHTTHKVAETLREAVKMAVMAGIDMSMTPNDFQFNELLLDLVRSGEIPESRLDMSVRRILKVKMELGLDGNPVTPSQADYPLFGSDSFARIAYAAVAESVTLLKNEGELLPLKEGDKLWVMGNATNSINYLNGAWSQTWLGQDTRFNEPGKMTILQALQAGYGKGLISAVTPEFVAQTARKSKRLPKAVIYCLGETPATEIPGNIDDLSIPIPEEDRKALGSLKVRNVPVVLVLLLGRPRIITDLDKLSNAVVHAYIPGQEGAKPLADILYGKINPSGRLPFIYPRSSGDIVHYDRKRTEDNDISFGDKGYKPLYDFGYGLSYTRFEYLALTVSPGNDTFTMNVHVKNTGSYEGKEVIQVYYRDEYAPVTPSQKKLCAFTKVSLKPGQDAVVTLKVPFSDVGDIGTDMKPFKASGIIHFRAGAKSVTLNHKP